MPKDNQGNIFCRRHEAVSKIHEQNNYTSKSKKNEEVVRVILVSVAKPPEVFEPGKESHDFPEASAASQGAFTPDNPPFWGNPKSTP